MKRLHIRLPFRLTMTLAAAMLVSTTLSLAMHTPTQALPLNVSGLTDTVTNVANNVPIVRNVTPLLMPITQTPTVTVTPTPQPITITNPTTPTPITTPDVAESDLAMTAQQGIAVASVQRGATLASAARGGSIDSVLLKQQEIAAAPAHVASPSISYESRILSSTAATVLFYSGIAGLCIGGWMMVVSRPKTSLIPAVIS